MKQVQILKIVVASPHNVQAERDLLEEVVAELNRSVAADRDLRLELARWETDAYPGFHSEGPQGLIDPILRIEDSDILIGIFWKRFGTPTKDAKSGTEYEIRTALEAWKENERPQIMVYFNQKSYTPQSSEEAEQWGQVLKFREDFPTEGLWWPYKGEHEFENLVRNHLTQHIRKQYPLPGQPLEEVSGSELASVAVPARNKIFISYSHNDKIWLDRLRIHLKPLLRGGIVDFWDDTRISPGQNWRDEIKKALDVAKVAVLLVSADFLASDFIAEHELIPLLAAAEKRGMVVLPVILSPSRFKRSSLSQFEPVNDPTQPLVVLRLGTQERTWSRLAEKIEQALIESKEEAKLTASRRRLPIVLESVEIRNFKNIDELKLNLAAPSTLPGKWTCVVGINGAGKSSILQAICLLLLGEKLAAEVGSTRLREMRRLIDSGSLDTELRAVVREGSETYSLYLPLGDHGVDETKLRSHPDFESMRDLWKRLQRQVLVSYGATRNLSSYNDARYASLSPLVQQQMTLFDPLTQIASIEVLLEGGFENAPILRTLYQLLQKVLQADELTVHDPTNSDRLVFEQPGGAQIGAIDLPDGFRSTVAWLAGLCAAWHATLAIRKAPDTDLQDMTGIVLLDELDLHLHPSLARALVPRLREALPKVQFIVTTHSPLVLASFDRNELVVLDQTSEGGVRSLDRQVYGLSTDQVYEWLMDTVPQSLVMQEKLREGTDPDLPLYLYQSDVRSEKQAQALLKERRKLLEDLGFEQE